MSKFGSPYAIGVPITAATYTYDATAGDAIADLLLPDTSSNAIAITLPSAAGLNGQEGINANGASNPGRIRVLKTNAGSSPVTVAAAAGSIVGQSVIYTQNQLHEYVAFNNNWYNVSPVVPVHHCEIALSSAEILALSATAKTLIPAPGSGKVTLVRGITLKMVTTATQYANGGALEWRYTDGSGAKVSADIAAAVVTAAAGTSYTSVAGVTTSLTNVVNAAVILINATAPFITGTGTAVVGISFEVLEL